MLNPTTNQEWIDSFLQGQLVGAALVSFHQKLRDDSAFTALFDEQKLIVDGIKLAKLSKQLQHFKKLNLSIEDETAIFDEAVISSAIRMEKNVVILERFKAKNKKIDETTVILKNRKRLNWLVAASLLFIVSSLGLLSWAKQNFSTEILVQQYRHEIDFNTIRMSGKEAMINPDLLSAYTNKNYKAANTLLQQQKETSSIQLQLLQGYLFLQLDEPQKALLEFSKIEATNDQRFIDNVKWYQALTYLQLEEIAKCKTILKAIIKANKPWYETHAKTLLEKLDHPLCRIGN